MSTFSQFWIASSDMQGISRTLLPRACGGGHRGVRLSRGSAFHRGSPAWWPPCSIAGLGPWRCALIGKKCGRPRFMDGVALPDPRVGLVVRLVLPPVRLVVGLVLRLLRLVLETSLLWYFAMPPSRSSAASVGGSRRRRSSRPRPCANRSRTRSRRRSVLASLLRTPRRTSRSP